MVYNGPSRGCALCRERHVKCDENRPSCQNCTSVLRDCPGYVDRFLQVWRNQNVLVPIKAEHERRTRSKQRHDRKQAQRSQETSQGIQHRAIPSTDQCLAMFWLRWAEVTAEAAKRTELTRQLPSLYDGSRSDSPLKAAVTAIAVNLAFVALGISLDSELPCSLLQKALSLTRNSLDHSAEALTDECLIASLLLGACDVLNSFVRSNNLSGIHKGGVLTLVDLRGATNFKSQLARDLLIAVRRHVIRHALSTGDALPENPGIWCNIWDDTDDPISRLDTYAADLVYLESIMVQQSLSISHYHVLPSGPLQVLLLNARPALYFETYTKVSSGAPKTITKKTVKPLGVSEYACLLELALSLESRLAEWYSSTGSAQRSISASSSCRSNGQFRDEEAFHHSFNVADTLADIGAQSYYQKLRISTIRIVICCRQIIAFLTGRQASRSQASPCYQSIVQDLADQACSNVRLYYLQIPGHSTVATTTEGTTVPLQASDAALGKSRKEKTHLLCQNVHFETKHDHTIPCSAAWYLLDPLQELLKITSPTSLSSETPPLHLHYPLITLRDGQRQWIEEQVNWIGDLQVQRANTISCG